MGLRRFIHRKSRIEETSAASSDVKRNRAVAASAASASASAASASAASASASAASASPCIITSGQPTAIAPTTDAVKGRHPAPAESGKSSGWRRRLFGTRFGRVAPTDHELIASLARRDEPESSYNPVIKISVRPIRATTDLTTKPSDPTRSSAAVAVRADFEREEEDARLLIAKPIRVYGDENEFPKSPSPHIGFAKMDDVLFIPARGDKYLIPAPEILHPQTVRPLPSIPISFEPSQPMQDDPETDADDGGKEFGPERKPEKDTDTTTACCCWSFLFRRPGRTY